MLVRITLSMKIFDKDAYTKRSYYASTLNKKCSIEGECLIRASKAFVH